MDDPNIPDEGGSNIVDSSDKNDVDSNAPSSYQRLKASHEELEKKLKAQENQAAAERRKFEERIKALEGSAAPKEDSDRIAALEVELARSKAVSRHGLSEDDAALLKGSPEQILADAEYWAERLKAAKPKDNGKDGKDNRDMIDQKLSDQDNHRDDPPTRPDPKKSNLSWLQRYQAASPYEREKMDKDVFEGRVNPRTQK